MARIDFLDPRQTFANGAAFLDGDLLFEMGLRAANGQDGVADLVQAHMYFNLADRKGCESAAFHRSEVAAQMTKSEVAKALRAARAFLSAH